MENYKLLLFTVLIFQIFLSGCKDGKKFELKTGFQWYPFTEWEIMNPSSKGNPFDVIAKVIFTHDKTGDSITTYMFYDNENIWKFRFTGKIPGDWSFTTISNDEILNGWTGKVIIRENPDKNAHGFMKSFGNKWGWEGTEEAFVPQYVMSKLLRAFLREDSSINIKMIEEDIEEFINGHGFTGFHISGKGDWFNGENPDPSVYRVLETIITRVHQLGGGCHIWLWYASTNALNGERMNDKDQRNLRYWAARLGPLPGWSISYGVDVENGWISTEDLEEWKSFLEDYMGWRHFLGARVGYDKLGASRARPRPPKPPPLDENYNAPVGDEYTWWLGGDYIGYTSYRPLYDRYSEVINHRPEKPSFEEDRFRLRNIAQWDHKDYDEELTRRGLWHSAMAGGVANIWGNFLPHEEGVNFRVLNTLGSKPYRNKDQIKTYSLFFENRFLKEFESKRDGKNLILYTPDYENIIIYSENTDVINIENINLKLLKKPVIVIDTKSPYKEIIVSIKEDEKNWKAPYISDWAFAAGNF